MKHSTDHRPFDGCTTGVPLEIIPHGEPLKFISTQPLWPRFLRLINQSIPAPGPLATAAAIFLLVGQTEPILPPHRAIERSVVPRARIESFISQTFLSSIPYRALSHRPGRSTCEIFLLAGAI